MFVDTNDAMHVHVNRAVLVVELVHIVEVQAATRTAQTGSDV